MSMQIKFKDIYNKTIYYFGTVKQPNLKSHADFDFTAIVAYFGESKKVTVLDIIWSQTTDLDLSKAERRITNMILQAWEVDSELKDKSDTIQAQDPGDEHDFEREYTIADFGADNIKRYKDKRVKLNRRLSTRRKQP